jgi:hypothetical protein
MHKTKVDGRILQEITLKTSLKKGNIGACV